MDSDEIRVGDRAELIEDRSIVWLVDDNTASWSMGDVVEVVADPYDHSQQVRNQRTGELAHWNIRDVGVFRRLPREQTVEERRASLPPGAVIRECATKCTPATPCMTALVCPAHREGVITMRMETLRIAKAAALPLNKQPSEPYEPTSSGRGGMVGVYRKNWR